MISALGMAADRSSGGENNCIEYRFFCIIIIITTISSSISMYFAVLLNCLYLNPRVSPFCPFSPPHPAGGEEEG